MGSELIIHSYYSRPKKFRFHGGAQSLNIISFPVLFIVSNKQGNWVDNVQKTKLLHGFQERFLRTG